MERHLWGWRGGQSPAAWDAGAGRLDQALRRLEEIAHTPAVETPPPLSPGFPGLACVLNPPALPDAVAETELRLGTALPADYVRFLLHCDGARLCAAEAETGVSDAAAELLGTEALVRRAEEMEYGYRAECIPELVIFAAIGTEGNHLAFDTGRRNPSGGCGVLDARRDYRPDQWWVIARDFTSWLDDLLTERGALASFGRCWNSPVPELQPRLPLSGPEFFRDTP